VTVSARIDRALREKLKRYGISASKVIRRALEEDVRKAEEEEIRKILGRIGRILEKIPEEEVVKSIRENRGKR
jgi:hypothetical protein